MSTVSKTIQITPTYSTNTKGKECLKRFIDCTKSDISTTHTLNEPSVFNSLLIASIEEKEGNPNLILFDNTLIAVKLIKINNALYQAVSILDLIQHYHIEQDRITQFKRIYSKRVQSDIPICDKQGNWLVISYLIPFLMLTCDSFANRVSNNLLQLFVKTSKEGKTFEEICSYTIPDTLGDITLKTNKREIKHKEPKKDLKHYIVYQEQKPILPRLITKSKTDEENLKRYMTDFKIDARKLDSVKIDSLLKFYEKLNERLYNPADMMIVKNIVKNKKLTKSISIIKIENDIESELDKLKGIKTKKVKDTDYTSLECYDVEYSEINENATLANLCKCGDMDLKPKSKIEGDKKLYKQLLELSTSEKFSQMLEENKTKGKGKGKSKAKDDEIIMPEADDKNIAKDDEESEEKEDQTNANEDDEVIYDV